MSRNPVCVIGSNSISGASFIRTCLERGRPVLAMSRSEEPHACLLPYRWLTATDLSKFQFYRKDLNHDTVSILQLIREQGCTEVVNFAAQSMVAESWDNPDHWYQTNVVANVRLHEGLRLISSLEKYVHVSTPEVYGSCSGLVNEDHPFSPSTPYAASRAACDLHLMTYYKRYGFPVVFTRAANVYGPGQPLYRIIPRTVMAALTGNKLQLHGGGHSIRSFIHLSDVAEATLRVLESGNPGEVYHISTQRFVSIRELVEMICQRMGVAFCDAVEVVDDRPGKDAAYTLNCTKIQKQLGWTDSVGLEEGVDEVISWARQWLEALKHQPLRYIHKA